MLRTILPLSAILSLLLTSSAVNAGKPVPKSLLPQPYDNKPIADGATVQLAESVMCGSRKACAILFGESPAQLAQLVRQRAAGRLARRSATVLASNSSVN